MKKVVLAFSISLAHCGDSSSPKGTNDFNNNNTLSENVLLGIRIKKEGIGLLQRIGSSNISGSINIMKYIENGYIQCPR